MRRRRDDGMGMKLTEKDVGGEEDEAEIGGVDCPAEDVGRARPGRGKLKCGDDGDGLDEKDYG